jgi:hypothetical protein
MALSWSRRRTQLVLGAAEWAAAGLIAWALVSRIAWFGIALIGLAVLFVASHWRIGDENALPTNRRRPPLYRAI